MLSVMLLSSSKIPGSKYLGYCIDEIREFLQGKGRMLFVPFAYQEPDTYTDQVRETLGGFVDIVGAHTLTANDDLDRFDVVFCGGGNTFLLLSALYQHGLLDRIRSVVNKGASYLGSSAGANVACPTISTTNDMPIVYPPSFSSLGLVPFNINPHYYETPQDFPHTGECRRDRIAEFLAIHQRTVVGMEEGAILLRKDNRLHLVGSKGGLIFYPHGEEQPVLPGDDLSFLLTNTAL